MSLRLTVLGGAAAWPNPGQGCSSYLVRSDNASVLLDCGPDTLHELRRHADYTAIDAVVLSHCHSDHILDLVPYRYGLIYGPTRPARTIPLWIPPGGTRVLRDLATALGQLGEDVETFWSAAFELREYDPLGALTIGDVKFSFASTQHFVPCFAMRVEAGGRALCYSSDTGAIAPLVELARSADLLIAEATLVEQPNGPVASRGHLTPAEAGELARQAGVARLLLTHLWNERPLDDVLREATTAYSGPVEVATPGLHVDV
jgi:ribonuclease BN (tRNA processing enzyme)